jgi:hypothetical protein
LDQAIISRLIQVLTKGIFMFLALAISAAKVPSMLSAKILKAPSIRKVFPAFAFRRFFLLNMARNLSIGFQYWKIMP